MSDPVTHHDIEDVLSSIRRLVAQGDTRRTQNAGVTPSIVRSEVPAPKKDAVTPEKPVETAKTPAPERLVLTPAFRITPQVDQDAAAAPVQNGTAPKSVDAALKSAESDVIPTKDSRPMPGPARSPSERASLEATIAELEAAVNSRSDEWEPDGSEKSPASDFQSVFASKLDAFRPSRFMRRREEQDNDAATADATDDAAKTAPSTESVLNDIVVDHIAEAVQEEIADSFPHLTAADEAPESASAFHAAALADVSEQLAAETAANDAEITRTTQDTQADDAAEVDPKVVRLTPSATFTAAKDASATAKPHDAPAAQPEAAPEPEVVAAEIAPEEVATPTFRHASIQETYDPVAEATADAAEAEAAATAEDIYGDELQEDPAPSTAVATPAPAGQLMDPDMLRDMVGEMIRAELQGEMGERITRNVRKLVRREINRVLSAQEFD